MFLMLESLDNPVTGPVTRAVTRRPAGRAAAKRTMDAEAAATWAYRDQRVAAWEGAPLGYYDAGAIFGGSGAGYSTLAALGVRVDGGWTAGLLYGGGAARHCHSDATAINATVAALARGDPAAGRAVFFNALTGERPAWRCAAFASGRGTDGRWHRLGPGMALEGEVVVEDDGAAWCPVRVYGGPATVALRRAEYAAWWRGLAALVVALEGRLNTIELVWPLAPRRPWETAPREPPAKGCRLLSATDRAALFAAHDDGARPADLAARFGLKPKAVTDMLYAHRRRTATA